MRKNILLFGSAPLPTEPKIISTAFGMRTLQFIRALEKDHHLFLFLIGGEKLEGEFKDSTHFEVSRNSSVLLKQAKAFFRRNHFDAVIGVNTFPSYIAAQILDNKIPFWADLNGWIMAEMQIQALELQHNEYLAHGWKQEKAILLRADHISTVSTPQKFATLGELAALGRLTGEIARENFVHVLPNAALPHQHQKYQSTKENLFRGSLVPKDAFVITQIGGFNNWYDEKTLFSAIEMAMQQDPYIHFVTTGGKIEHVADTPFERFVQRIEKSKYKDRFHCLGWIAAEKMANMYSESDIGIMADILCTETETGARNRLNEMISYALPCITTQGSEISFDIERWQCGKVVESGNFKDLSAAILELKANSSLRDTYKKNCAHVARKILTPHNTVAPLLKWLQQKSPPLIHRYHIAFEQRKVMRMWKAGYRFLRERGGRAFLKKLWQYIGIK